MTIHKIAGFGTRRFVIISTADGKHLSKPKTFDEACADGDKIAHGSGFNNWPNGIDIIEHTMRVKF